MQIEKIPFVLSSRLKVELKSAGDPQRALDQQAYMKSSMPYYGVGSPERKKISRKIFREFPPENISQYEECLSTIFKQSEFREEWYCALDYGTLFSKFILEDNIKLYLMLVRKTQWWDMVDGIAAWLIGPALLNRPSLPVYLREWIKDENLWIRRTALLAQLKYKAETDFELLSELILTVSHEKEFFIRKAIGWVLRQYSYENPPTVKRFISQHENHLSTLSIKEGLKAIQRIEKTG